MPYKRPPRRIRLTYLHLCITFAVLVPLALLLNGQNWMGWVLGGVAPFALYMAFYEIRRLARQETLDDIETYVRQTSNYLDDKERND